MAYKILYEMYLPPKTKRTGKTTHYHNGTVIKAIPQKLQIVQYENDNGFYLIQIDSTNNELSDTYHDSIEDAKDQAAWEFDLKEFDWK